MEVTLLDLVGLALAAQHRLQKRGLSLVVFAIRDLLTCFAEKFVSL